MLRLCGTARPEVVAVEQPARVGDLRSLATPPYPPPSRCRHGGRSVRVEAPIGSPAYATRDARDITPSIVEPRRTRSLPPRDRVARAGPAVRRAHPRSVERAARRRRTPAQRSEFACDRMFGDPLLARGYAYASSNKGEGDGALLVELGRRITIEGAEIPRCCCRTAAVSRSGSHAPGHRLERWRDDFVALTERARRSSGRRAPRTGSDVRDRALQRRL